MIGSFLTRGLVMVFGYAYPAYECFKSVEKNKPDIEQLRFWCQYWYDTFYVCHDNLFTSLVCLDLKLDNDVFRILVAVLTVCERIGDTFVSWVPMYSEAKLAFYIYLWYPRTKGTTYVYDSFFRPYISKHETDIDRNLMELRTRAGDIVVLYWQRAASYGQTRVFDVLQYIASQSTPKPRTSQPPQTGRARQPAPNRRAPPAAVQQTKEPPTPASSSSSSSSSSSDSASPQIDDTESEGVPPTPTSPATALKAQKTTPTHSLAVTAKAQSSNEAEMMETEPSTSSNPIPSPKETIIEEVVRVYTRGRSRKNSAASVQ
ncbi:putative HVA22-like protein g isoform X1 [Cynara cardunculus var. scolymus]|uniref:putative HVA22-like protein g isoform X1 n=1 Tax=Cynara cardunculus var. scolymus TaxID=59895 RepID=UPI000D625A5A|nr:putative HVA22-like protein g isoform X1 [Cynara cardunculus var. scolymus]XP_024961589.1 putative HVA22-like protein g isoform X1 [Cynara cardunculus var. scolymus]